MTQKWLNRGSSSPSDLAPFAPFPRGPIIHVVSAEGAGESKKMQDEAVEEPKRGQALEAEKRRGASSGAARQKVAARRGGGLRRQRGEPAGELLAEDAMEATHDEESDSAAPPSTSSQPSSSGAGSGTSVSPPWAAPKTGTPQSTSRATRITAGKYSAWYSTSSDPGYTSTCTPPGRCAPGKTSEMG